MIQGPSIRSSDDDDEAHLASLKTLHETRELRHVRVRHPDDDDDCPRIGSTRSSRDLEQKTGDSAHSSALWAWPR